MNADVLSPVSHDTPERMARIKQPRSGPNFREAPNAETALMKALRTAEDRAGEPIFFPYEGTIFNSREEGKEFYNLYSWEKGFGVRFTRGRKNDEKYMTKADIVCSCQGIAANPNSASSRTNCMARIRLLRRGDHAWYISEVNDSHNHTLTDSYEENQQWKSHGFIDPGTKEFIKKLRENNVSLGRVCNVLGLWDRTAIPGIRKESVRALCAKLSQEKLRDDIGKTIKLLEEMKQNDPGFEVKFRVDTKGQINSMLWCTGKNRADYAKYGDAMTFDTTYRTNLYSLPFGIFVGINNEFQSTIFGGVLLTTEKTVDFEWAFSTFVEIMGGKAPKTILTGGVDGMC
ncbi:unnamed protein product [Urochloa decumbens]|uniref:Protein FAR1-RELATED SEQUENCE n=1 Tax=Urochloa decumbens TaxID=240449 RepID=A0ABC9AYU2_9POAL